MTQNQILGTDNNDILSDTLLNDEIFALDGNDEIKVSAGNDTVDGGNGEDTLVVDYSEQTQDLMFYFNLYGSDSGSIDVNSMDYTAQYSSRIDFNSIEKFIFNSGSGNDVIDLGYNNTSDDFINAGAGDDFINAGLGNDTIDGGEGFDVLRLDFSSSLAGVASSLNHSNSGQYSDGHNTIFFSKIEAIDVMGSSYDDVLVAVHSDAVDGATGYLMNSLIDGGNGEDTLVVDYSKQTQDLMFYFNLYGSDSGSIDVNSMDYTAQYSSRIDFNSIEKFIFNSGSGNDAIDLGYNNTSDDFINAGAGDDSINAGLGNDTIDGGSGSDTYIFELGHGMDLIADSAGDNDVIILGSGITLDNLSLNFEGNNLNLNFVDFPEEQIIIENYSESLDSIENIQVEGQTYLIEDILALQTEPKTIGEFGKVFNFDHNSQTIQLDNSYENPVVFALPLSRNGGDPAVVRITDIQDDSFTAYLQEAEYKDGSHVTESFSYMVLEAGTWELDNGALLEVGIINTNAITTEAWENINFNADFADTPVILSQVQTNQESDFVRTRQKNSSIDGFSLSMEEEDALKASGHANETVGWLAIDSGKGNWGELKYEAGTTGRQVNHNGYSFGFSQDFADEPSLFASLASFYGGDSSGLRYRNLSSDNVQIMIEEDRSLDSEIYHTREIVDFMAISGNGDLTASIYEPINFI